MARAYSSLDSPRDRLATVCRLRNDVIVVLRELLNIITELHEPGRLVTAAAQIKFSCCWQAVSSAELPTDRCFDAPADSAHRVTPHCAPCVCRMLVST